MILNLIIVDKRKYSDSGKLKAILLSRLILFDRNSCKCVCNNKGNYRLDINFPKGGNICMRDSRCRIRWKIKKISQVTPGIAFAHRGRAWIYSFLHSIIQVLAQLQRQGPLFLPCWQIQIREYSNECVRPDVISNFS